MTRILESGSRTVPTEENKPAQDFVDALKSSGADSSVLTVDVLQGYQCTGGSDARNGMSLFGVKAYR
jgi:hypothetical protein